MQCGDGEPPLPVDRRQLRRWVVSALEGPAELTLRFVGLTEGRRLNQAYRGQNHATNVLTFPYDPDDGMPQPPAPAPGASRPGTSRPGTSRLETPRLEASRPDTSWPHTSRSIRAPRPVRADIVICLPVLEREARQQKKSLRDHLAHLVIHGVLHAQGYDHLDDGEATRMETRETAVLRRFRIADPYQLADRRTHPPPNAPAAKRTGR